MDCCQGLLQESEVNPDNYFHRFVTGDETWVYYYDSFSQQEAKVWQKTGEERATRLDRTRPPEKIMMTIFWDKYSILQTEYLPGGTAISDPYYASIIERLHCALVEKDGVKVVLLLHDNAPVYKCNIVQAAIRKASFVELTHPAYSPDIVLSDSYRFSNLKKFLSGKNFSRDEETIDTIKDSLNKLDLEFFYKGIQSLRDWWVACGC